MGYTHYWKTKRAFTEKEWKEFTDGTKKIIKKSNVSICGGSGEGMPIIDDVKVSINGSRAEGDDYETFYVTKEPQDFEFCKTARCPYDKVAVACLLLMEKILGSDCEVSSDGDMYGEDWANGRELFKKAIKR